MTDTLWILVGVLLLYAGGEALVGGARRLALRLGVRPMVIGLTVVALGTSTPELAATLTAAFQGAPEVAFGNVVGSNIANLGLVLGLGAVIYTMPVEARFLLREMPFMLGSSVLMIVVSRDGELGRLEGALLLVALIGFLWVLFRAEREDPLVEKIFEVEFSDGRGERVGWILAMIAIGIVALALGAKALVLGAVGIARALGVEERVIGLTVVAFGTSLPELAGTLVAAAKREGDIILGNLIGSNVFNILFILGGTMLIHPIRIDAAHAMTDMLVMLGISTLVWPLMLAARRLGRWQGLVLVTVYVGYVVWLFAQG